MESITWKTEHYGFKSFGELVYAPESYKLSRIIHKDYPEVKKILSNGHEYDLTTNIFSKLPNIFSDFKIDSEEYVQIFGRVNNNRVYKWIKKKYIVDHPNLNKYKVLLPKSNGSGEFGEVLSTPLIAAPNVGHTQTFISIGSFDSEFEAKSALKYISTKFARALLGTLKVTQDNKKAAWAKIPMQDFTDLSDINWEKSTSEIDKQLYLKYNFSGEEIRFIEENVTEMSLDLD